MSVAAEKMGAAMIESFTDVSAATGVALYVWHVGPRSQGKCVLHGTRNFVKRTGLKWQIMWNTVLCL
jgi:hypothetical protein